MSSRVAGVGGGSSGANTTEAANDNNDHRAYKQTINERNGSEVYGSAKTTNLGFILHLHLQLYFTIMFA